MVRTTEQTDNFGVDAETAKVRLAQIKAHPIFAKTIATAMASRYDDVGSAKHIEQQIYGGLPSPKDGLTMTRLHSVPWNARYALAQTFEDPKYREFAERITYAEQPDDLPIEQQKALAEWCQERRQAGADVPWMTVTKMKAELEDLRASSDPGSPERLSEIALYIEQLEIQ